MAWTAAKAKSGLGGYCSQALPFSKCPFFDMSPDVIPQGASLGQLFLRRTFEVGRIGEAPEDALGEAGEKRAAFISTLVANANHTIKALAPGKEVQDTFGGAVGDVDANLLHDLHRHGIQYSRLETGALCLGQIWIKVIQPSFRHLAASRIPNTDEQDLEDSSFHMNE